MRSDAPLAPGMHKLQIAGFLPRSLNVKDLTAIRFERTLMVTVGEPVTDPDGKL